MKKIFIFLLAAASALPFTLEGAERLSASIRKKGEESIRRGIEYLVSKQKPDGSIAGDPAFTALAMTALSGAPSPGAETKKALEKARIYLLSCARADGSFYGEYKQYINYTTALALSALAAAGKKEDEHVMKKARGFILDSQLDEDHPTHPTKKDDPFYGGIGYGSKGPSRPDLSNTQWALEALHLTEHLDSEDSKDTKQSKKAKEAWEKARAFLEKVQNVPENAPENWTAVQSDPKKDGGFIYMPGDSKASSKAKDKTILRSYGSMTYAGLKSMVYAKMGKDDVRVKAAVAWASNHYTLDENPNMGMEGHFYYLLTFAKALDACRIETLKAKDGINHNWKKDLIIKAAELQNKDGSWTNANGRWMESMGELSTAYMVTAVALALKDRAKIVRN